MTATEFAAICGELLIDPEVALESKAVRDALKARKSIEDVRKLMTEEF